ncbi:DUF6134 family protein [Magnetospirillum sp. 64-120]|uniref:DUF6134 family protein n=1 Tax=Magnetospirillum sp. 64-120 TaxID=1895778 RepID=UPI000928FA36|nr:DUF6134 family protein [Magnetospirillum sp. 64-120]OJX71802.1 MAG: hypothetical protein BGO92_04205 [Magnetospirillum sp. 64-120]
MRFVAFLTPLALSLSLTTGVAIAGTTPGPLDFTVLRNGEAVGAHHLRFQPTSDNGLQVSVDTNVVVKMAMIPVYRFEHHGHETWKDGRLVALASETNDDGTHHVLKVDGGDGGLSVNGDGKTARLAETLPASLWNDETVKQSTLLNTLDGHAMAVRIADLGADRVAVGNHMVAAHHYAMTGDLSRELWYDASGTLVQVRFKAKDDSDIQYVLR